MDTNLYNNSPDNLPPKVEVVDFDPVPETPTQTSFNPLAKLKELLNNPKIKQFNIKLFAAIFVGFSLVGLVGYTGIKALTGNKTDTNVDIVDSSTEITEDGVIQDNAAP